MSNCRLVFALLASLGFAVAHEATPEPQTTLRSVVNGVSFQSAPATVARGGILAVLGTDLASAHIAAEAVPLPVALDDPAVEVLINGTAVPLFFVSASQINAQVPWEIEPGWAQVVARRGGVDSAVMPVIVSDNSPNVFHHEGTSSPIAEGVSAPQDPAAGPAGESFTLALGSPGSPPAATGTVLDASAAISAGDPLALYGSGLGQTVPAVATGSAGTADRSYSLEFPPRGYLGGIPVSNGSVELSRELVGVYKLSFTVPELAGSTEVFRWYSGDQGASGVLGPIAAPAAQYMAIPEGVESVRRIDMTDLNPYYVAVSGALDETEGCYSGAQLLDLRRDTATALSGCILPSYPNAPNPDRDYRPFEVSLNSPVLAALVVRPEDSAAATESDSASGVTDRMVLIDSAAGTTSEVTIDGGTDRLQPSSVPSQSRNMRLLRPEQTDIYTVVDPSGAVVGEEEGWVGLPQPLEVDGLTRVVAQGSASFAGGYRVRFLGPDPSEQAGADSAEQPADPSGVLFDRAAQVVAKVPFPDGWAPIVPPRRTNAQGVAVGGNSIAPATPGFRGDLTAYVVARKTDGTQDGVVAFRVELPEDSEADPPETASMTATVTPFPSGVFAANCTLQVRWQRIPLTQTIAIAGSGEALSEYAEPRDDEICTSDQLVLFDTQTAEIRAISVPSTPTDPAKLDVAAKGTVGSYLYFADGARDTALAAPQKIHVFDGVAETFTEIAFPGDVGITINFLTQHIPGRARAVAIATGGPLRTNSRTGASLPPLQGNRGLLVIDLPEGTATHLALPEGFERVIVPRGALPLFLEHGRGFGVIPLIGRAFAHVRRPNSGPGNPGGSAIVTWDVATGTATEIAMPEGGFAAVQSIGGGRGGGGGQGPFIWNYRPRTASFAFGVYSQASELLSVGVVGP